jgi:hypothetical protein
MIINSGRFNQAKPLILQDRPYENFMQLSDWLFETTGQTHKFELQRLFSLVYQALTQLLNCTPEQASACLMSDYTRSGLKGQPDFNPEKQQLKKTQSNSRQQRH